MEKVAEILGVPKEKLEELDKVMGEKVYLDLGVSTLLEGGNSKEV